METLYTIKQSEAFASIVEAARADTCAAIFGAHAPHRAAFAAALCDKLNKPVLFVTALDRDAARAAEDMAQLGVRAYRFPSRELAFIDALSVSREEELARIAALDAAFRGEVAVYCCSAEALCSFTMPKDTENSLSLTIENKGTLDLTSAARTLAQSGYVRVGRVEGAGQFSVRGGILDVFSPGSERPVRAELFGDEVDRLFEFDHETQRKLRSVKKTRVLPAREVIAENLADAAESVRGYLNKNAGVAPLSELAARDLELLENGGSIENPDRYLPLFFKEKRTLFDLLPGAPVMLCEPLTLEQRTRELISGMEERFAGYRRSGLTDFDVKDFYRPFSIKQEDRAVIYADVFARSLGDIRLSTLVNINGSVLPRLAGDFSSLAEEVKRYTASGFAVVVMAGTQKTAKSWAYDLSEDGVRTSLLADSAPQPGTVSLAAGTLSAGFEIPSLRFAILSGRRVGENDKLKKKTAKKTHTGGFGSLEDLHEGDYVVHINHGIGRFEGIHRIDYHGLVRDYIKIKYRGEDVLYLPVTQLDMVSPYVSPKEETSSPVQLAKLHSGEWAKTKQQVYRGAREMAKELIALYKKRGEAEGVAFPADDDWQREFETRFPYDETGDQLRVIDEIKADMQRPSPMDRLLCGDVGVGKTEVALRAAFKCVTAGKQCAVLVPTTILAWQHYGTFLERMESYPIKIAMLSRFTTAKDMREAVKGIENGTVDIAIGTHRLLQKDVKFRRLGLLIIDEEQRFGVSHKEKLKEQFSGVDVLTLSATPIPRTLNMAMSGIRDMSVIEEPPQDRSPVQTYVIEYDEDTVREAIRRELARGGQVYYLHNRVDSIERCAEKISGWFPEATVGVAHGKMGEDELSDVWRAVMNGDTDILVCTTIIETGVDVPNCNTLIVENSDRLGLAQLYQIRGRVGRSARRAYAYFTFRSDMIVSETAQKRLGAIRDFTSFGSGFRIAMQDLQIRGAGGVLSAKQSGHMAAVGYETYVKILEEAVDDEQGIARKPEKTDCVVDLSVNAYIPESYIAQLDDRLNMYKKIAALETAEDSADLTDELEDRFGKIPDAVRGLISVSLLRYEASGVGIYEIKESGGCALLYSDRLDPDAVLALARAKERKILVSAKGKSYVSVRPNSGESTLDAALFAVQWLACRKEERDVDDADTEVLR